MLVGNKLDLVLHDASAREVPAEAAAQFAKEENLMFIETSAQLNNNVRDAFEVLLNEIFNQRQKRGKKRDGKKPFVIGPNEEPTQTPKGGCCG